jgi:hypothetical protein
MQAQRRRRLPDRLACLCRCHQCLEALIVQAHANLANEVACELEVDGPRLLLLAELACRLPALKARCQSVRVGIDSDLLEACGRGLVKSLVGVRPEGGATVHHP